MVPALHWNSEDVFWFGLATSTLDAVSKQNCVIVSLNRCHDIMRLLDWCETLGNQRGQPLEEFQPVTSDEPVWLQAVRHLCDSLPENPTEEQCVDALAQSETWKPVLILTSQLGAEEQKELAERVAMWADRRRRLEGATGPLFIVPLSYRTALPQDDIGLTIVHAHEHPVSGDLTNGWAQVIAADRGSPLHLWQTAVFPELATFDATLPNEYPWNKVADSEGLVETLGTVRRQRGWDKLEPQVVSLVSNFPAPGSISDSRHSPLPDYIMPLWEHGMCGLVAGCGWDLHGALLDRGYLQQRAWRGQTGVVRPLVEIVRCRLEQAVRTLMSKEAFDTALTPLIAENGPGRDDPATAIPELNDLANIADQEGLTQLPCYPDQMRACHRAVRNPLAHGQPVSVTDLAHLTELLKSWK
jgi:hypothetical protein